MYESNDYVPFEDLPEFGLIQPEPAATHPYNDHRSILAPTELDYEAEAEVTISAVQAAGAASVIRQSVEAEAAAYEAVRAAHTAQEAAIANGDAGSRINAIRALKAARPNPINVTIRLAEAERYDQLAAPFYTALGRIAMRNDLMQIAIDRGWL